MSKRGGSKGDVRRGATARGTIEKGGYARVIERKKVRGDDPIKCFLPCTNQQSPQRRDAVPDRVWVWSEWLLSFPRVPVIPGTPLTQTTLLPCCPLNDRRRTALSFFEIVRLSSLFSCLSLARLRLLFFSFS